jgi:hypothetical protein
LTYRVVINISPLITLVVVVVVVVLVVLDINRGKPYAIAVHLELLLKLLRPLVLILHIG